VAKLNPAGSGLLYATFLGGSDGDRGSGIAVDGGGNAYVTGPTYSSDFPTTPGAFDTTYSGPDVFVAKLNPAGSGLVYATFLGGSSVDHGFGIAVDGGGNAYVTGVTASSDFPAIPGVFDTTHNGEGDAFVAKLNPAGSGLVYATFLGGSSDDQGFGIAVDGSGNTYVTGRTYSSDFPTTPGAFDTTFDGYYYDAFVVKLVAGGVGPPAPFLDLPFEYTNFAEAALKRVSSWFDHKYPYPTHPVDCRNPGTGPQHDDRVTDYTGATSNPPSNVCNCRSNKCYDGHNGIDFTPGVREIRPAAGGTVVDVETNCTQGNRGCGGGYGNYVILDHWNGYFTRYAHLESVNVIKGTTVTPGDTLGIMGSTGNSNDPHLHFSVYRDNNGNRQWDGESVDKPVDPYDWDEDRGGSDPWVEVGGPTSYYLWIHPLSYEELVSGSQGATMTDTTGNVQASIPPDAFSGQAIFELSPGPVAGSSAQLRSSGHSFWLRLLEWLPGGVGLQSVTALQSTTQFTLTKPITLTVTYTDTDVLHLEVTQLALHRWDEEQEMWQPLTTTLDLVNHVVNAQTEDLGDFDLQAPLLCATDDLEPDDGYAAARWVWPNDWPLARGLDIPQDSDWARFDGVQGARYTIGTQNLAGGVDTVLNLYDVDALTLLASNDDADSGPASELVWTAPYTGTFFVETVSALGGTTGCSATYELTITTIPGDVIADCRVDIADIMQVASHWRCKCGDACYHSLYDTDGDCGIDIVDLMLVVKQWGETCP